MSIPNSEADPLIIKKQTVIQGREKSRSFYEIWPDFKVLKIVCCHLKLISLRNQFLSLALKYIQRALISKMHIG